MPNKKKKKTQFLIRLCGLSSIVIDHVLIKDSQRDQWRIKGIAGPRRKDELRPPVNDKCCWGEGGSSGTKVAVGRLNSKLEMPSGTPSNISHRL